MVITTPITESKIVQITFDASTPGYVITGPIIKNITTGHTRPWVVMGTGLGEYSGAFANRHVKLHDNSARDGGDYVSNVAPDSNYVLI